MGWWHFLRKKIQFWTKCRKIRECHENFEIKKILIVSVQKTHVYEQEKYTM